MQTSTHDSTSCCRLAYTILLSQTVLRAPCVPTCTWTTLHWNTFKCNHGEGCLCCCRHSAGQAALDARNSRWRKDTSRSRDLDEEENTNRVEKAEKRVNEFVARRLSPAVQRVRKTPVRRWFSGVRSGAGYVGGLWGRSACTQCCNS